MRIHTISPCTLTNKYFSTINPSSDSLHAYKFARGKFVLAGNSQFTFAGKSVPTMMSANGQAGTDVVWLADVNHGLVAYKAVPVGGTFQPINVPVAVSLEG